MMDYKNADFQQHQNKIQRRYRTFHETLSFIQGCGQNLEEFTKSYETHGISVDSKNNISVLEWAPGAANIFLRGEFSDYLIFNFIFGSNFSVR
jgi:hypothetical protein